VTAPVLDARPDGDRPVDPTVVAAAAEAVRAGGVVVVPTDTVYGLAASPAVPGATDRIFAAKGRAPDVPLAVLCAHAEQAFSLADPGVLTDDVRRLVARHWPGPLTLVLPRRAGVSLALGDPPTTVGVRCPDHALVRALAEAVGPIAATSANRHGEPTAETAAPLAEIFGDAVDVIVDGGRCGGAPSTVVDVTGARWRVLRIGALSLGELERRSAGI
jgi:L-threonylcarbamoyladenylate synthase